MPRPPETSFTGSPVANRRKSMPTPELPSITTDDLLKMIGDRDVTIARQAALIAIQAARIAELDDTGESRVTTTTFDTSAA